MKLLQLLLRLLLRLVFCVFFVVLKKQLAVAARCFFHNHKDADWL